MNGSALDGFLARAVPVRRVALAEPPDWRAAAWLAVPTTVCGLLAPTVPSPESIEGGWVIAVGAGFEADLAGLLRGYGLATALLALVCLLAAFGLSRLPDAGAQMGSLFALGLWLGASVALLVTTGLFLLVAALNAVLWFAVISAALALLGLLGGDG
ncbi:MAG: hypothetical protein WD404_05155 [Solirubrobacterales bacterium]